MANNIKDLLGELSNILNEASNLPLSGGKCIVDKSVCLEILSEVEDTLPLEIKQATLIVQSKNEILESAKQEADNIIRQAEEKRRVLISDGEIMQAARKESAELMQQATDKAATHMKNTEAAVSQLIATTEAQARDMQRRAYEYADGTLRKVEDVVNLAAGDLQKVRGQLNKTTGS